MPAIKHVSAKSGDTLLLVGTMKGLFVVRSNAARKKWEVGGPYSHGSPVYAAAFDQRNGKKRLWWAQQSWRWGTILRSSDDFGRTSTEPETYSVKFPEETKLALKNIWQIMPGHAHEPNTLYCGVEPASLFKSTDNGASWALVKGLHEHPHREKWQPGGGGLCLHTIVLEPSAPENILIAISAAGAYRSTDGGKTWQVSNKGVRAEFMPDKYPEFGQCVHKIAHNPAEPQRYYLQNHWGLYRSDDGGASWHDIAKGVPSDFGFCMVAHPHDADTVYIVPIESDEYRCTPEGKLRVYRTRNGGKSWEPLTRGLPQKNALETVLRDGMATDTHKSAGIYFGTRSGKVYGSNDNGNSWQLIMEGLPPVVCVKAAVVNGAAKFAARSSNHTARTRMTKKARVARKSTRKPTRAKRSRKR